MDIFISIGMERLRLDQRRIVSPLIRKRMELYLPDESLRGVFLESDIAQVNSLCRVNRRFATLCHDEGMWREKAMRDFGPDVIKAREDTWKKTYRLLHAIRSIPIYEWIDRLYAIEATDLVHADHAEIFELYDYDDLFSSDYAASNPHATIIHMDFDAGKVIDRWNVLDALGELRHLLSNKIAYASTHVASAGYREIRDQIPRYTEVLQDLGFVQRW